MAILSADAAVAHVVAESRRDAPWIVMVHGASQDHRVFSAQAAAFRQAYRLLLIDLPGHGASAHLPGPFGTEEYAASILAAIEAAGIDRCHYWGTHTGAVTGLLLACREAVLFDALILEGPFDPGQPLASVLTLFPRISEIARTQGLQDARDTWWRDGRWFDVMRARPDACRAAAQRAMIEDFGGAPWLYEGPAAAPVASVMPALAEMPTPCLMINGEHDLPDFLAAAEALQSQLPNVRREIIPDGGGFPLWEFPDRVNAAVGKFLAANG